MSDIERPMGNAELRLAFASITSEIADVKGIAMDTHSQAKKTNGRVNWLEKIAYTSMGALPLLTFWAAWLTWAQLNQLPQANTEQIQAAVAAGVDQALKNYESKN